MSAFADFAVRNWAVILGVIVLTAVVVVTTFRASSGKDPKPMPPNPDTRPIKPRHKPKHRRRGIR